MQLLYFHLFCTCNVPLMKAEVTQKCLPRYVVGAMERLIVESISLIALHGKG